MGSQQKEGRCWHWQHVLDFTLTQLQGHFYYPILTFQIASILWRQSGREGVLSCAGAASGCGWDSRMEARALLKSTLCGVWVNEPWLGVDWESM